MMTLTPAAAARAGVPCRSLGGDLDAQDRRPDRERLLLRGEVPTCGLAEAGDGAGAAFEWCPSVASRRRIAPGATACHLSVMRWASALSQDPGTPQAVAEAVAALRRGLGGGRARLVGAFVSPHPRAPAAGLPPLVAADRPGGRRCGWTAGLRVRHG